MVRAVTQLISQLLVASHSPGILPLDEIPNMAVPSLVGRFVQWAVTRSIYSAQPLVSDLRWDVPTFRC
jgi:hypothetical protein